jgi:hypothetical protein
MALASAFEALGQQFLARTGLKGSRKSVAAIPSCWQILSRTQDKDQ